MPKGSDILDNKEKQTAEKTNIVAETNATEGECLSEEEIKKRLSEREAEYFMFMDD